MNQVFNISSQERPDADSRILAVRLGQHHFGFAISNGNADQLFQLTWYMMDETGHHELDDIYLNHPELRDSFSRVVIGYDHPHSILVPPGPYTENDPGRMLETMYGVNGLHTVLTENITEWQLQNVYAVPADVQDWMMRHFSSAKYRHNYSVGIKQIDTSEQEGSLLIDFRSADFTLVASKAGRLLLAQTFSYATPADVIYYLLKICRELSFSQQTAILALSGLVEKESSLYRELEHYFLHIRFRLPAWQVMAADEENYPAHFFTSLNDLALCAS